MSEEINDLSLANFPDAFYPLVVVMGDRREERPKSKGDLLAYSMSSIDIIHLLTLGLKNVPVVTDKTFVLEDSRVLRDRFGDSNIITIGSPAVNLFSRQINEHQPFRFDIPEAAKQDLIKHEKFLDGIKYNQPALFIYKQIFEYGLGPEEIAKKFFNDDPEFKTRLHECTEIHGQFQRMQLNEKSWKFFIHNFDRPGISDPIDKRKHAVTTRSFNDFGLVSVAKNPFSKTKKYVISVAGIHGIATAHGVKLLSDPTNFAGRPCGGVFEVEFPEYGSWSTKMDEARVKWQTKSYSKTFPNINSTLVAAAPNHQFKKEFGVFVSSPYSKDDIEMKKLNEELGKICSQYFSGTQTAYSIKTSGKGTFPTVIQAQIVNSTAVIHLLNHFKAGVLFEVGLSIGSKKTAFLAWDEKFGAFKADALPELLSKLNVIRFNSSDVSTFSKTVIDEIIEPALEVKEDKKGLKTATGYIVKQSPKKPVDTATYAFISPRMSEHSGLVASICKNEFRHPVYAEKELLGENRLAKQCWGIGRAKASVFLLDDDDREGSILLGIARSLNRKCLLMRGGNLAMWNGEFAEVKHSTIVKDVEKGLRDFFNSIHE